MQRVGPYHIPFPYAPYPLQEHAMTALRDFLENSTAGKAKPHDSSFEGDSKDGIAREAVNTSAATTTTAVAVLESPTGTGKSQMLLNSVLSYLYDPVYPATDSGDTESHVKEDCNPTAAPAAVEEKRFKGGRDSGVASPTPRTLEEVLQQRQLEEEMERLRRERKVRVRAQRQQLRKARKLMQLQQQQGKGEAGDEYLLAQDPVTWYTEQQQRELSAGMLSSSSSSFSYSSSSSESPSDAEDEGSEAEDAEGVLEANLATMLPLRKPKIYIASRTHTQLQQLMEDLQRTAFAQYPLRPRIVQRALPSSSYASTGVNSFLTEQSVDVAKGNTSPIGSARRLMAVHVAGRPHLCLNARLRRKAGATASSGGGSSTNSGEVLNYYCREAMQYERSKQGRAERRRREYRAQQQGFTPSSHFPLEDKTNSTASQKAMRDMEDLPSFPVINTSVLTRRTSSLNPPHSAGEDKSDDEDKGCVYCVESHLRALMTYLINEQRQQHNNDPEGRTPTTSLYTMDRLRHLGNELQACPYLATRLLLRGADVVFIPYSYLLDETQRAVLLGGVTTNPVTATEAEAVGIQGADDMEKDVSDVDSRIDPAASGVGYGNGDISATAAAPHALSVAPTASLSSVLYHRRQRVTATAAFRQRQKQRQEQGRQQQAKSTQNSSLPDAGLCGTLGTAAGKGGSSLDKVDDEDELWYAMARSAPPSLRGDILVFDEAHNIADHCRTTSTVSLSPWHLRLAEGLCEVYLSRYESRLLTRNKQRLRELIRFLGKLYRFCTSAATFPSTIETPAPAAVAGGRNIAPNNSYSVGLHSTSATRVYPFHTFLFEAGIDSVDVYSLLLFLVDSQLLMKLQGFVGYCLEKEREDAEAAKSERHTNKAHSAQDCAMPMSASSVGIKRKRSSNNEDGSAIDEQQRQPQFFTAVTTDTGPLRRSIHPEMHPHRKNDYNKNDNRSINSCPDHYSSSVSLTDLLHTHVLRGGGVPLDPVRQRSLAAEALQRIEKLLAALYVSDAVSTRVIWTPSPPVLPSTDATNTKKLIDVTHSEDGGLKLIQLEPGTHTFAPLAREARAVVLAGGTMQPLAFSCGPLLPMGGNDTGSNNKTNGVSGRTMETTDAPPAAARNVSTCNSAPEHCPMKWNPAKSDRVAASLPSMKSTSTLDAGASDNEQSVALPIRLISEGHVVPPTSVRVFTLGTGPSGVRMEFTQQALGDRRPKTTVPVVARSNSHNSNSNTSTVSAPSTHTDSPINRMLVELACTLLNLVRVLPPAGAICFFTSYDAMDRVVAVLQSTGYYDQINEVKRIFCETRDGKSKAVSTNSNLNKNSHSSNSGLSAAELLQQYQNWIYGDEREAAATSVSPLHLHSKREARRGALLFAVMGGRLSEGINFADDLGRAVIVLGMPYANPTDVELQLILHHIATTRLRDNKRAPTATQQSRGIGASSSTASEHVSGDVVASSATKLGFTSPAEWGLYMDGMMRTVNQCIGRCIRHAGDYAAIILLDARYGERAEVRRRLSTWLQTSLQVCHTFGECFAGVRGFFFSFAERRASSPKEEAGL